MEDSLHFDIHVRPRERPARRARSAPRTAWIRGSGTAEQPELLAPEPINVYHWAAVALVTALMCAVLGFAAGTPALSRAAGVTSVVFSVLAGALLLAGASRALRVRLSAGYTGKETSS
jgi:uncharacterized membrane protein YtjA (UPF0391 family)